MINSMYQVSQVFRCTRYMVTSVKYLMTAFLLISGTIFNHHLIVSFVKPPRNRIARQLIS